MHVAVLRALGFIQADATREHHIRTLKKSLLAFDQHWRSTVKVAQLVHAIVDRHLRLKLFRKAQGHRCVIPGVERLDVMLFYECSQQLSLRIIRVEPFTKMWLYDPKRCFLMNRFYPRTCFNVCFMACVPYRLFPEKYPPCTRSSAEQVLWPLSHEVPAKMAETQ